MFKPTLFVLFVLSPCLLEAQKPVVHQRYTPDAPATYSTPSTPSSADEESRRAAALAKIQGKTQAPATYSTTKGSDDLSPVTYSTTGEAVDPAPIEPLTTVTVNGSNVQRRVRKGSGQVGNDLFTPVSELYYVQFAVYCKDTPVDKAPPIDGLYLLWHAGSTCPGGAQGASYIVKGYNTPEEAKEAVEVFKARKLDCWYNPALTGAAVEIIGVR